MSVNGSQCHGVACVRYGDMCAAFGSDFSHPGVSCEHGHGFLFPDGPGPKGGSAVGAADSLVVDAGSGGAGTCPVFDPVIIAQGSPRYGQEPTYRSGPPRGIAGEGGNAGVAIMYPCSRAGAYTLALQRCPGAAEWTLHGLWPGGVRGCSDETFATSLIDAGLQEALAAKWPTCRRGQDNAAFWKHEWEEHGTCTGLSQQGYFLRSLELLKIHVGYCANVTRASCHLCLTKDFNPCGGLEVDEDEG